MLFVPQCVILVIEWLPFFLGALPSSFFYFVFCLLAFLFFCDFSCFTWFNKDSQLEWPNQSLFCDEITISVSNQVGWFFPSSISGDKNKSSQTNTWLYFAFGWLIGYTFFFFGVVLNIQSTIKHDGCTSLILNWHWSYSLTKNLCQLWRKDSDGLLSLWCNLSCSKEMKIKNWVLGCERLLSRWLPAKKQTIKHNPRSKIYVRIFLCQNKSKCFFTQKQVKEKYTLFFDLWSLDDIWVSLNFILLGEKLSWSRNILTNVHTDKLNWFLQMSETHFGIHWISSTTSEKQWSFFCVV